MLSKCVRWVEWEERKKGFSFLMWRALIKKENFYSSYTAPHTFLFYFSHLGYLIILRTCTSMCVCVLNSHHNFSSFFHPFFIHSCLYILYKFFSFFYWTIYNEFQDGISHSPTPLMLHRKAHNILHTSKKGFIDLIIKFHIDSQLYMLLVYIYSLL